MSLPAQLAFARIQRIDAPTDDLFAITLAARDYKGVLLASLRAGTLGAGLTQERPKGAAATSFVQKLRKELSGARLTSLDRITPCVLELRVTRGDGDKRLMLELGASPDIVLIAGDEHILASLQRRNRDAAYVAATGKPVPWADTIEELERLGSALLIGQQTSTFDSEQTALLRGIDNARKRMTRKLAAIAGDAARSGQAHDLRARATLLLSNLHQIKRGMQLVRLQDFSQDPPTWVEVQLDPAQSARDQAEAWFTRARRFERGEKIAQERAAQTRLELSQLEALATAAAAAPDLEAVQTLIQQARPLGVRLQPSAAGTGQRTTARSKATRLPYRELRGFQDRPILVGRGAADNDALTLKHARPQDLFLHARDVSGAHVIVPLARNEPCPPELLRDAAHLAAHFSDSRGEPVVDISYTPRRHIRKPKSAPPGAVTLTREKVLHLHLDPPLLKRLLATELPPP